MRFILALLVAAAVLPAAARAETAIFAGGCFWCVESDFDKIEGVTSTVSGFAGGRSANPTYESHEGHLEAVQVEFDPSVVSYDALAQHFLRTIDVTDGGGQFCDRGEAYTTALFASGARQKDAAARAVKAAGAALGKPIATPVREATAFTAAGAEHQDYYLGQNRVFTRFGLIKQADAYKRYRKACGRDARVREVWGDAAYTFPVAPREGS
jgi:peptide-methionine (S)-S-oxide reductase